MLVWNKPKGLTFNTHIHLTPTYRHIFLVPSYAGDRFCYLKRTQYDLVLIITYSEWATLRKSLSLSTPIIATHAPRWDFGCISKIEIFGTALQFDLRVSFCSSILQPSYMIGCIFIINIIIGHWEKWKMSKPLGKILYGVSRTWISIEVVTV